MYHTLVPSLAQRVLSDIRRQELLKAGNRVGVAVSGGIDSVALLRLLLELRGELGIVLSVVHFNHKLRGAESDADEKFVANLARDHGLEFFGDSDDVAQHASQMHVSIEAAARELRYGFFRHLLGADGRQGLKPHAPIARNGTAEAVPRYESGLDRKPGLDKPKLDSEPGLDSKSRLGDEPELDKIVTGHTLDDQAETVLMRMMRGAGMRGLGGIHPRMVVEDEHGEACGEIVRLILGIRRDELKAYLFDLRQAWREDSSNADERFTRNRVRQLLVPLLEKEFNPAVAENLSELAEIARDEEDFWENEVAGWMGTGVHWSEPEWAKPPSAGSALVQIGAAEAVPFHESSASAGRVDVSLQSRIDAAPWLVANASVDRIWFLGEPIAAQRRVIKAIGERAGIPLEFKHVEEIRRCAEDDASGKELSLPLGWKMVREPDALVFVTPDLRNQIENPPQVESYRYEIAIPSRVVVAQTKSVFEFVSVPALETARYNSDELLDASSLARSLRLRNWRPGDRFWPAHTKSPKKIKELLQELHIPQTERKLWPVVACEDEIVWMRAFATPAKFQPQPGRDAILIIERTSGIQP
jgi:tRNA(Ile)-lysidine synthase